MLRWLRHRWRSRTTARAHRELAPFRAEVLLDGAVVATLSEPITTDMFWRSYRITPVGRVTTIQDDELWACCRFVFRDPASGEVCTTAFVGGRAPFVREGRVALRGLYVGSAADQGRKTR